MPVEIAARKSATFQLRIGELGELLVEHRLCVGISIAGDTGRSARCSSFGRLPDPGMELGRRQRGGQGRGTNSNLQ
jgi:hypothetical protein